MNVDRDDSQRMLPEPGRRREKLRQMARSAKGMVKQEINKLYDYYNSNNDINNYDGTAREITVPSPSPSRGLQRSETDELDSIINNNVDLSRMDCMTFPTYAVKLMDPIPSWAVSFAGWTMLQPTSSRLERWLLAIGRTYAGLRTNSDEDVHFAKLVNQFRCQTLRNTEVSVRLGDVASRSHSNADIVVNSGPTGKFEYRLVLADEDVAQCTTSRLLPYQIVLPVPQIISCPGTIHLIEPTGLSIISDIDDTIKITNVLDGSDAILKNTFFNMAQEVPGMSNIYREWAARGAQFHYVSNSPWQVLPALEEFIENCNFPRGSMHLRAINTGELFLSKPGKHKLDTIPQIIKDFPQRRFILVGDSGEIDPEIYQSIQEQFPDQIVKVFIHDVSSKRAILADQQAEARRTSDSMLNHLRKFLTREAYLRNDKPASVAAQDAAIGAVTATEVPQEQAVPTDGSEPVLSKLELFEQRIQRVSSTMPDNVFTLFSLASQLGTVRIQ